MRTYAKPFGCIAIGLALALSGPAAAQADDDSFVDAAQALGFPFAPPSLITTARSACYFLSRNRDPTEVLERIIRYTRVEPDQARQFFALSINEYCPQYQGAAGP